MRCKTFALFLLVSSLLITACGINSKNNAQSSTDSSKEISTDKKETAKDEDSPCYEAIFYNGAIYSKTAQGVLEKPEHLAGKIQTCISEGKRPTQDFETNMNKNYIGKEIYTFEWDNNGIYIPQSFQTFAKVDYYQRFEKNYIIEDEEESLSRKDENTKVYIIYKGDKYWRNADAGKKNTDDLSLAKIGRIAYASDGQKIYDDKELATNDFDNSLLGADVYYSKDNECLYVDKEYTGVLTGWCK